MILPPGAEADKRGGEGVSGGNKKPALDERERDEVQFKGVIFFTANDSGGEPESGEGLYDACVNGKTDIGTDHHIQTGTISEAIFGWQE